MNAIFTSLELDKEELRAKFICILNEELSDSNFIVSSFISNALRAENSGSVLVSLQRSFSHYNLVGIKSGFNLNSSLRNGSLLHIDVTDEITKRISEFTLQDLINKEYLTNLILRIKSHVEELNSKKEKVILIVDCLSDLINCGVNFKDVFNFVHNLRVIVTEYPKTSLVIGAQFCEEDRDKVRLRNYLMTSSDYRIIVLPLKTGFSTDVSGCIKFSKRDNTKITSWTTENLHHFKVTDRNIKIFTPGSVKTM